MTKSDARSKALSLRKALDEAKASSQTIESLKQMNLLQDGMQIGMYYPLAYEINLLPLLKIFPNCYFYLPVVNGNLLDFVLFNEKTDLKKGPFHTLEPVGNSVSIENLDILLIPCLAISKNGKRLGYGKGYYDLTFKDYKGIKVGICYKELEYWDIDMEPFDLQLDWIL